MKIPKKIAKQYNQSKKKLYLLLDMSMYISLYLYNLFGGFKYYHYGKLNKNEC